MVFDLCRTPYTVSVSAYDSTREQTSISFSFVIKEKKKKKKKNGYTKRARHSLEIFLIVSKLYLTCVVRFSNGKKTNQRTEIFHFAVKSPR